MNTIRCGLLIAAMWSATSFAQESRIETERKQKLEAAQTMEQALDLMTPAELAEEMGFGEDQFPLRLFTIGSTTVTIDVSIKYQTLTIKWPEGSETYAISSGRAGYATKRGEFYLDPNRMYTMWHSRKYHMSPMPHAMFYYGGFAIHGTSEEGRLGRPASHGCIRVARSTAARLYSIVKRYGATNTYLTVY